MYHRFAFYALFPLVAFVAVLIPIAWLVKLLHISIGMFPWSLILGVGLLPIFVAGAACCSGGLVALWVFLRWPQKYARFICVLPLSFIPVAIYLGQFLAKFVSEGGPKNLFIRFDVLSIQAHLLYPIIALVLVALTWVNKSASPDTPTKASTTALKMLTMWSLVLSFWALSAFAVISTEGYVKQYLAQLHMDQEQVIDSDNDQPIVVAISAG
jgi:hypothetical protein